MQKQANIALNGVFIEIPWMRRRMHCLTLNFSDVAAKIMSVFFLLPQHFIHSALDPNQTAYISQPPAVYRQVRFSSQPIVVVV